MSAMVCFVAVSSPPTRAVPVIRGWPVAPVLVVSSSRIVMSSAPMAFEPKAPVTVTVRLRSAVSFPVAVTVTSTELSPVRRTTWWPAVFGSASPGFTL